MAWNWPRRGAHQGLIPAASAVPEARPVHRSTSDFKLRTVPGEYHRMKGQTKVTSAGLVWLRHRGLAGPGKVPALQAAVAARQAELPGI